MAITVQFTFDDAWALRIQDAVVNFPHLHNDEVLQALLEAAEVTWEDLTAKQKWKVLVLRETMFWLIRYEGDAAATAAKDAIIEDIEDNFPLDFGPA